MSPALLPGTVCELGAQRGSATPFFMETYLNCVSGIPSTLVTWASLLVWNNINEVLQFIANHARLGVEPDRLGSRTPLHLLRAYYRSALPHLIS